MAAPLSAPVYATAAQLAQYPGPQTVYRYAIVETLGLFKWYANDTTSADNTTVIAPSGGAVGRWKLSAAWPGASAFFTVDGLATSNITLSGEQTIDGVAYTAGDVILPTGQNTASENVPWTVSAGAWTRPTWYDSNADAFPGQIVSVQRGTNNGGTLWRMSSPTSGSITLGTTSVSWAEVGTTLSDAAPAAVGTTSAGVAATASRADHVHALGAQTSITVTDGDASATISRTAANTITLDAAAGDTIRVSADSALYLDATLVYLNDGGAYSQFVSPRFTVTGSDGVWLDSYHTSLECIFGLRSQFRLGGSTSEPYIGLHGRLPVEIQSAHDLPSLLTALAHQGVISDQSLGYTVHIFGDSLWSSLASTPDARACRVLETLLTPSASVETLSIPGEAATSPAHSYRPAPTSGKSIAIITYGANNFVGGQSAATVQTAITAEVAALVAAGYDAVVVATVSRIGVAPGGPISAGQLTELQNYNTWLAANYGSIGATAIVDVYNATNLTDPTDTTYFQPDQVHLTDAGHAALAAAWDAPISALLTGQALADSLLQGNDVTISATDDVLISAADRCDVDAVTFDVDATTVDVTASSTVTFTVGGQSISMNPGGFAMQFVSNYLWIVAADQRVHRATSGATKLTEDCADAYVYNFHADVTSVKWQNNGTTRLEIDDTGIGVLGAAPSARIEVTGSRGGNAALASLLTALATFGWITDSTTA